MFPYFIPKRYFDLEGYGTHYPWTNILQIMVNLCISDDEVVIDIIPPNADDENIKCYLLNLPAFYLPSVEINKYFRNLRNAEKFVNKIYRTYSNYDTNCINIAEFFLLEVIPTYDILNKYFNKKSYEYICGVDNCIDKYFYKDIGGIIKSYVDYESYLRILLREKLNEKAIILSEKWFNNVIPVDVSTLDIIKSKIRSRIDEFEEKFKYLFFYWENVR